MTPRYPMLRAVSCHHLPELLELERVIALGAGHLRCEVACRVRVGDAEVPVHAIVMGGEDPALPAIGYFGGIHGLERIGTRVVTAFLHSLLMRLPWDGSLRHLLQRVRILFMPLVNPAGMARGTRANAAGVDLMRNAPVDAQQPVIPLVGGHRLSPWLPWYRGARGAPMQPESTAVCAWVERELYGRPFSMAIDCHSGFGLRDRIWFPFAHRRAPMAPLAELHALHAIFVRSHAQHTYVFEPQSSQYLANGDLWDHLLLRAPGPAVFLPLTLEMGSWLWVRKNPRQLFSRAGIFNPLVAHREQRVLRRHLPLLDFMLRATASHARWQPPADLREAHRQAALRHWYGARPA